LEFLILKSFYQNQQIFKMELKCYDPILIYETLIIKGF